MSKSCMMYYRTLLALFTSLFLVVAVPVVVAQQAQSAAKTATPSVAQVAPPAAKAATPPATEAIPGSDDSYHLGSGDKIHVGVFGQPDLNGDYVVDGGGSVQLPLIGAVKAVGLTVAEFQKQVTSKFSDGYLVNPNVEVDVVSYRPFYIIGEIRGPGQYPYVNGMSILNAVALAGGFTDRADKSEVYIRRNGSAKEIEYPADETTKVNPGDIVRISERFF
jgi:protein involved in polysaccharide export with SLBB domain